MAIASSFQRPVIRRTSAIASASVYRFVRPLRGVATRSSVCQSPGVIEVPANMAREGRCLEELHGHSRYANCVYVSIGHRQIASMVALENYTLTV
jgi:hypothetical protein